MAGPTAIALGLLLINAIAIEDTITNADERLLSFDFRTFLAKCLWLKWANSWAKTDENCPSLSACKKSPPFTPIIPPGAAKALSELSSISKILNDLFATWLYSESR